jgi:hypothetical protein
VILVLFAEQLDTTGNSARGSIAKRAERFAADVIADVHQQVYIAFFAITMLYAMEDLR